MRLVSEDFDYKNCNLDLSERYIRDNLGLDIENWAKFRHGIYVGTDSKVLKPRKNVTKDVKETYLELGKSHYEVITTLGYLKISMLAIEDQISAKQSFLVFKLCKEFYFHSGCLLDNLARLIYIIVDNKSVTKKDSRGCFVRHWFDWGKLKEKKYPGYIKFCRSKKIKEIINVRNQMAHSWRCIIGENYSWPEAIRNNRDLKWPYDNEGWRRYKKWLCIKDMIKFDFEYLEKFQNNVFKRLFQDISRFEKNNKIFIG